MYLFLLKVAPSSIFSLPQSSGLLGVFKVQKITFTTAFVSGTRNLNIIIDICTKKIAYFFRAIGLKTTHYGS
tara:strand:- start:1973 stop:2188 length:216 start_codon:yes stop_codon:yes gene_type:complete